MTCPNSTSPGHKTSYINYKIPPQPGTEESKNENTDENYKQHFQISGQQRDWKRKITQGPLTGREASQLCPASHRTLFENRWPSNKELYIQSSEICSSEIGFLKIYNSLFLMGAFNG